MQAAIIASYVRWIQLDQVCLSASQPESEPIREKTGCQKTLLRLEDIAELREVQEKKSWCRQCVFNMDTSKSFV
jgi:hypothetical protein